MVFPSWVYMQYPQCSPLVDFGVFPGGNVESPRPLHGTIISGLTPWQGCGSPTGACCQTLCLTCRGLASAGPLERAAVRVGCGAGGGLCNGGRAVVCDCYPGRRASHFSRPSYAQADDNPRGS